MKSLSFRVLSEKLRFSCFSQVPTGSDYPVFRPILSKISFFIVTPFFENKTDNKSMNLQYKSKGGGKLSPSVLMESLKKFTSVSD